MCRAEKRHRLRGSIDVHGVGTDNLVGGFQDDGTSELEAAGAQVVARKAGCDALGTFR